MEKSDILIKEKAIPLILFDNNSKLFKLSEEGSNFLKSIDNPFCTISIGGMYRTGKSYLINKVLLNKTNKENGFKVGDTVNPCTKGLWIWSDKIKLPCKNNEYLSVYIIDTEGFGAYNQDQNYDYKLFLLALFCSSLFLYNSIGSIDETSIQNLSFVINLAKLFDKTKISCGNKEANSLIDEFPSFIWIIRDFSLKLENDCGNSISANEYLELVLQKTSNTSNKVNDNLKNLIRTTIKNYFKTRECITLVRPITDENKLQSLSDVDDSELRPEFLNQLVSLRKKILDLVKPKTISDRILNGNVFCDILSKIINSVNKGNLPQVNNLYSDICNNESIKAYNKSLDLYETNMSNYFLYNKHNEKIIVNTKNTFNYIHNKNYCISIKEFILCMDFAILNKNNSIYNNFLNVLKLLEDNDNEIDYKRNYILLMSVKYSNDNITNSYIKLLEELNFKKEYYITNYFYKEVKIKINKILHDAYSDLEYKVYNNRIKIKEDNLDTVYKEMDKTHNNLIKLFPDIDFITEYFNDFKSNILSLILNYIIKTFEEELCLNKSKYLVEISNISDKKNELESKLNDIIFKNEEEIDNLKQSIIELNNQIFEKTKEINNLKKQIEQKEIDFEKKVIELKDKNNNNTSNLNTKIKELKEIALKAERNNISSTIEHQKEQALLNQKIEYLNSKTEELKLTIDKFKKNDNYLSLQKHQQALKDINNKNETYVNELNNKILSLNNIILEYELLNNKCKDEIAEYNESINSLKNIISEHEKEILDLKLFNKNIIDEEKKNNNKIINEIKEDNNTLNKNIITKYKNEIEIFEKQIELLKEENNKLLNSFNISKQEVDFLKSNLNESEIKYCDLKYNNKVLTKKLQQELDIFNNKEELLKNKLKEIENKYNEEKSCLVTEYENSINNLKIKYDQLNELLNKEIKISELEKTDVYKELNELKLKLEILTNENNNLKNKKKQLDENIENLNEDNLKSIAKLEKDYELKLERLKDTSFKEISDINYNSEDKLKKLKAMFELDKARLEEKIRLEKNLSEKKIKNLTEVYESKITDTELEYKNLVQTLQHELDLVKKEFDDYIFKAEKEVDLLKQSKETLEELWEASKQALVKNQKEFKSSYENQADIFSKERIDMMKKIENFSNNFYNIDKEYMLLKIKKEQLDKEIIESNNNYKKIENELNILKKESSVTIQKLSNKLNDINEEYTIKKLEFNRENALLKQQIEFLNDKIEEMKELIDINQNKYEENLHSTRQELEKEYSDKIEKIEKDKEIIEDKYAFTKKELKELEHSYLKNTSLLEKEKAIVNEKLDTFENKLKETTDYYKKEIDNMRIYHSNLKESYQKEKEDFENSNEFLKNKLLSIEKELNDKTNVYIKDKEILENRCSFVENQRDKYKNENLDIIKRYEDKIDNLQEKTIKEIENIKNKNDISMTNQEMKYKKQISDLQESHKSMYIEMVGVNKELEKELKCFYNNNNSTNINNNKDCSALAIKIQELLEIQENLKDKLNKVKEEKDKEIIETTSQFEMEKEQLRNKISVLDTRLRESESKKSKMIFESEKIIAELSIEKNQLINKINDLEDTKLRLEERIEIMNNQIDRIRGLKSNNVANINYNNNKNISKYSNVHNINKSDNFNLNEEKIIHYNELLNKSKHASPNNKVYNMPLSKVDKPFLNPNYIKPKFNNINSNFLYAKKNSITDNNKFNNNIDINNVSRISKNVNNIDNNKTNHNQSYNLNKIEKNYQKVNVLNNNQIASNSPGIYNVNINNDLSNIDFDEAHKDERFYDKSLIDSSFESYNSLRFDMSNINNKYTNINNRNNNNKYLNLHTNIRNDNSYVNNSTSVIRKKHFQTNENKLKNWNQQNNKTNNIK